MKTGIYLITSPSGKRYVGSAVNLRQRRATHWHHLRRNNHHNRHLQRSWNRYNGEGFEFRVLLVCAARDLVDYEQAVIDGLQPEFNICKKAGSTLGVRPTAETKAKLANAMRQRIATSPATHEEITKAANARMRALHKDPSWRPEWEAKVQAFGETMARMITWEGRTQSVTKWAQELGVPRTTLKHRINSMGVEAAFSEPFGAKGSREAMLLRSARQGKLKYCVDGSPVTKTEFAAHLGVSRVTLRDWENRGMTQEQMAARAGALLA
jgi:group I intron endonuclease